MSHRPGNINPRVSSRAINGDLRGQKRRIRKSADRHRNHVRQVRKLPVQRRAATRAEVIGNDLTAVADARVGTGRACDLHLASGISRLNSKGAACPPLACQTVTNRNANGIALNIEDKLSAATACLVKTQTRMSAANVVQAECSVWARQTPCVTRGRRGLRLRQPRLGLRSKSCRLSIGVLDEWGER